MNPDSKRTRLKNVALACLALLVLLSPGCSRFSSKNRHLRKAQKYYAAGAFAEAELEYRTVLQRDRLNAEAIGRLGIIYYEQGLFGKAMPYLLKGNELEHNNAELELKLGQVALGRNDTKNAREQALAVLRDKPTDPDAPVLLALASPKAADVAESRRILTGLPLKPEENPSVLVGLAMLDLSEHKLKDAEALLGKALDADPKSSNAHFFVGSLHWLNKDVAQADKSFQSAFKFAPPHSPLRLKYAQFKIKNGDQEAAVKVINDIIHDAPDYVPAHMLLAELYLNQKKLPDAQSEVGKVLQRDPSYPEAIMLRASIDLAGGDKAHAIEDLERMKSLYPRYAEAYEQLGQVYLSKGDLRKAITELGQAVQLNPEQVPGVLLLAQTQIRLREFKSAASLIDQLLRKHPGLPKALLLKADALRGQGDYDGAVDVYRSLEKALPKEPEMIRLEGMMFVEQNKLAEARACFDRALALAPSFLPAVEQAINVDLAERKYASALARAKSEIEKAPKSELPRLFLAKVYLSQNDRVNAEAALLKTIELKPEAPTAYYLLAQLYEATNREDKALANLKEVIARSPKSIGASMMMGIIYEKREDFVSARKTYEKILELDPNFASALNNLAYLYSEKFGELEKGFELAQRGREAQPNEPHMADTLGWILFKKQQYTWALGLLQESGAALPEEAEIQYHLGMALYMVGNEQAAKAALGKALQLQGTFPGSDQAKLCLSLLNINASEVPKADLERTEKLLSGRPADPVALTRLAGLHEREGQLDKALSELQEALRVSPSNVTAHLSLAELHASRHEPQKALDAAKEAHKLAPDDPAVSQFLGQITFQAGDFKWAYSLRQEAARLRPDDPQALYNLATAAFAEGKVQEAEASLRQAMTLGPSRLQTAEATRFLGMIELINTGANDEAGSLRAREVLKADPEYAPALVVEAGAQEARHERTSAIAAYEKVLKQYPDFSPAQRRLAILYSEDPARDQQTSDLVSSAREAFPSDPELDRASGIVAYRKKNFTMAANLLDGSSHKRPTDAELLYYLGMARMELKETAAGRKALQSAIELGLRPELAVEAKRALAAGK